MGLRILIGAPLVLLVLLLKRGFDKSEARGKKRITGARRTTKIHQCRSDVKGSRRDFGNGGHLMEDIYGMEGIEPFSGLPV
jgi:hypothetical protein